MQPQLFHISIVEKDVAYTPDAVARQIIAMLNPYGKVLDPCRGKGAFYDNFPIHVEPDWCEITEGRDFFQYQDKVDWVIGNPPYSLFFFQQFLQQSFKIADHVCFLLPVNKVFQSWKTIEMVTEYGGIKDMFVYGSGSLIKLPFGFPAGLFHFEKGYQGKVDLKFVRAPSNTA